MRYPAIRTAKSIVRATPWAPNFATGGAQTSGAASGFFFRFDSKTDIIIFAWVNDENTLRASGSKTDPYAVFQRMLERGHPPDDWAALKQASRAD
jgi:hypothetical protein